jgi:hypothetical protein
MHLCAACVYTALLVVLPQCGRRLELLATYYFRLVIYENRAFLLPCDLQAFDIGMDPAALTCGQALTPCERYPCPPTAPLCSPDDVFCFVSPCPQRTCASCAAVLCPNIACPPNTIKAQLPGQCCPSCQFACADSVCTLQACPFGQRPFVRAGECCPTACVTECSEQECGECPIGSVTANATANECCPCSFPALTDACALVRCQSAPCPSGFHSERERGQCCPTCVPDAVCSTVCPTPVCRDGYVPSSDCCPRCVLDCSRVACPAISCGTGLISVTPTDQCCPICVEHEDCSELCPLIECPQGSRPYILPGKCCPTECRAPLAECELAIGSRHQALECVRETSSIASTPILDGVILGVMIVATIMALVMA